MCVTCTCVLHAHVCCALVCVCVLIDYHCAFLTTGTVCVYS